MPIFTPKNGGGRSLGIRAVILSREPGGFRIQVVKSTARKRDSCRLIFFLRAKRTEIGYSPRFQTDVCVYGPERALFFTQKHQ